MSMNLCFVEFEMAPVDSRLGLTTRLGEMKKLNAMNELMSSDIDLYPR